MPRLDKIRKIRSLRITDIAGKTRAVNLKFKKIVWILCEFNDWQNNIYFKTFKTNKIYGPIR